MLHNTGCLCSTRPGPFCCPLTLELLESPLQLVVVEGSLSRESRAGAGPPDGAEAGAGPPAVAGAVRWAGPAGRRGQGAGVIHGWGERSGGKMAREAALKLHDSDETSPQRHRRDNQKVSKSFQFKWLQRAKVRGQLQVQSSPGLTPVFISEEDNLSLKGAAASA